MATFSLQKYIINSSVVLRTPNTTLVSTTGSCQIHVNPATALEQAWIVLPGTGTETILRIAKLTPEMNSSESTLGLKEGGIPRPFCLSGGWTKRERGALTASPLVMGTRAASASTTAPNPAEIHTRVGRPQWGSLIKSGLLRTDEMAQEQPQQRTNPCTKQP